jgi:hypothetical protein
MIKPLLRGWGSAALLAFTLSASPFLVQAQTPNSLKAASQAAKVTPDLLNLQLRANGAVLPPDRNQEVQNEYVIVDGAVAIEASASDRNGQALLAQLQALGLRQGVAFKSMIFGYLPVDKLDQLKNISNLTYAHPYYKPDLNVGKVTSQGDKALRADIARQTLGVDGTGTKVGVISDSYNYLGGAAAGVASGDLPAAGVQVLDDYLVAGASDEGRAMAEIVHDVAPGAAIAFNTANRGQAGFAQGIKNLAAAGCNVIVDDIIYLAEPFFQDGIVGQAVNEVVANDSKLTYFSSAGNRARVSYEKEYVPGPLVSAPGNATNVLGYAHDFGGKYSQRITVPARGTLRLVLQWDQPFRSVSGGTGATTDMDILIYQGNTRVAAGVANNIASGDPVEVTGTYTNSTTAAVGVDVYIVKYEGPDPGRIKWINFGSTGIGIEFNTNSGASFGHNMAAGCISVAAAPYYNTPAYNVNLTTPRVESFSSAGGTPMLFDAAGNRLAQPEYRQKPEITSVDGGNNTFFGSDYENDGFPNFFGTSAAAPHAAAVAALMQQKAGNNLIRSSVLTILQQTALDMDDPLTPNFDTGFDYRTGYGFIQADKAIQAIAQPLALVEPKFNCQTGALTFQTTGGDGSPIEYQGIGITDWNPNPNQFLDAPVLADQNSKTVELKARQNGKVVTYVFNFRVYCQGSDGNQPPVLANPLENQFARRGAAFAYQIPATTFSDPNGDVLTYSISGLPDGLSFNASTRRISGTPTQVGTFPIIVTATDPGNLSAQAMLDIIVVTTDAAQPLALIAPLYNCSTGAISFRTTNGDGTSITYFAIGISRDAPTNPNGVVEAELRADPKPIVIQATQSGVTVSYTFDLAGACGSTSAQFRLIEPTYSCATGVFTFRVANATPGKTVEYYSVPGITGWTTNPTHQFDSDLRTAGDVRPFTLRARYVGEPASEVTLEWVRPAPCSSGARVALSEQSLQIQVLGNPTSNDHVDINVTGIQGQTLQLRVLDALGKSLSEQSLYVSGTSQRQRISLGHSPGIYLLQAGDATQLKTIKLIKQ